MEIIVSHINADFDAFASMVAAKRLYPNAEIVFPGSQEKKVRDFIDAFHPVEIRRLRDIDLDKVKRLILVDTKSPDRIGSIARVLSKGVEVHIYDHHPLSEGDIRGKVEVIEEVGATITILIEILKRQGIKPTPMEATIMSLGIHEETGSLLFPSTTERDILALGYLLKYGASLKIVSTYLRAEMSKEEIDLLNELIQTSRDIIVQGLRVRIAKASREGYYGDAAHFAHRIMDMEDLDALVVLLGMEGKVLIVGRSRVPEIDISKVLREFGGGGHPQAASATIKEIPLEIVEERVISVLKSAVVPRKTAGSIMTRPVVTIDAAITIKEAESLMTKYGVNVFPVISSGRYAGIITREVVEKALFHGFRESKVIDFTTTDVATATRDTPLDEIETIMIEHNQRFVPVLEDEKIIGAITRTDLLRALYEESLSRARIAEAMPGKKEFIRRNLSAQLRDKFPKEIYEVLKLSGEIAESKGQVAYLVGGSVRDLLRGEQNLDIDIVIEGDGIEFAKDLALRLGARVRAHEKFGTAKIIWGHRKIDIATARTEYYEFPAALPTVEVSSIKKDLYRRDFTINTLAVKLNPSEFGNLVDFFGAQRDLREKTIRVLHDLSFVEDPTRAFRAIRFAERFGFKLSKNTENLIKTSLKMNLFEKLSGARLREEFFLIFEESDPVRIIKRLSEYDLLWVIHPKLFFDAEMESLLNSVQETLLWFDLSFIGERPRKKEIYLMAIFFALKEEQRVEALLRLSVSSKVRDFVLEGIHSAKSVVRQMPFGEPALVFDALSSLPLDVVLFAMSLVREPEKKKEFSRYLLEWRHMRPILRGKDLIEMGLKPGPVFSTLLKGILRERLRGNIKTRQDEESFVREFISKNPI